MVDLAAMLWLHLDEDIEGFPFEKYFVDFKMKHVTARN